MIGPKRTCKSCGHACHCYRPDCDDCINDICVKCDCKTPDENKTNTDARSWDGYLR